MFGEFQDGEKPFATVEGRKTHVAKITMYSVFSISISKFLISIIHDGTTNEKNMLNKLYTSIFVQKLFDSGTF